MAIVIDPQPYDETIELPAVDTAADATDAGLVAEQIGGVRIAAGSAIGLQDDTASTLRARIHAVAMVLTFGFSLFLIRGFFLGDVVMQSIRLGIFIVIIGCVLATRKSAQLSLTQLRVVERLLFTATGLQLGVVQVKQTIAAADASNTEAIVAITMFSFVTWIYVVMMYGMFIPNTWVRALWFVAPASVIPTALTVGLGVAHPVVSQSVGMSSLVAVGLMSVVAAVCSLCGTHIVNSLRREAYEARQYGQYRLLEKLGSGGMGEVHLAEHRLLKRPSAIKLIRPGVDSDPSAIARFESEVQATATLSHWNTVEIFDYGRADDGTFYYVMEYLPGLDLEQIVRQHGPMSPARVTHFLLQICGALDEAHQIGLIHRDIKPANIIAARRGGMLDVAKLVDFGLARQTTLLRDDASSRTIAGSPSVMSPEQFASPESVDARSDLYSLGVTGYFLLTGRYLFEGASPAEVLKAHLTQKVVSPSHFVAVPAELEQAILRCVEKDPASRFQNAGELRSALLASRTGDSWTAADADEWWNAANEQTSIPPAVFGS